MFTEMDQDHHGKINLSNYIFSLEKCPDLLEIYDFMNNSFNSQSIFEASVKKTKDQEAEKLLINIKNLETDLKKLAFFVKEGKSLKNSANADIIPSLKFEKSNFNINQEELEENLEFEPIPSNRTFKKIDESVKKLLIRANLDPENLIRNVEENILSEEMSERKISEKIPFSQEISQKNLRVFRAKFQTLFPKFVNNEEKEEEKMNTIEKGEDFVRVHPEKPAENGGEIFNAIKNMQNQVKTIKEQMEVQLVKDFTEYFLLKIY